MGRGGAGISNSAGERRQGGRTPGGGIRCAVPRAGVGRKLEETKQTAIQPAAGCFLQNPGSSLEILIVIIFNLIVQPKMFI